MKITINEHRDFQLENVYNPVTLLSDDKEKIGICMRDSGFELWYQKSPDSSCERYEFKGGIVTKIPEAVPGSYKNTSEDEHQVSQG